MGPGDLVSPQQLLPLIGGVRAPVILDVRRSDVFDSAPRVLPASRRANHLTVTAAEIGPAPNGVVLVCKHGHNVSALAAARLRSDSVDAAVLSGGIAAWIEADYPTIARAPDAAGRFGAGTTWVTRRRPKIDRVACPWFLRRFVDDRARFLFVEDDQVLAVANELGGVAFDIPGAPVEHDGERCSFDTLLDRYEITDPVLRRLAIIVRGADTDRHDLAPEAAGLFAVSLGMARTSHDDLSLLGHMFPVYDALHHHLRFGAGETHRWTRPSERAP
jgi:rhodanese-related sulfurtransferase